MERSGIFYEKGATKKQMVGKVFANMSAQLSLWEIDIAPMKAKAFGRLGEDVAARLLERSGYEVSTIGHGDKRGDLLATDKTTGERWRVEVKAARRGKNNQWQFCLRRFTTRMCTDVAHADIVLLLAFPTIGNPTPFLIPTGALAGMKQIGFRTITTDYSGKWARYCQRDRLHIKGSE